MKLLIVHNNYKSNFIGGEDLVFEREYKALKEKLGEKKVYKYQVFNDKMSMFTLIINVFFSWYNFLKIYNIIKKEKIDIVHIHNFFPLLSASIFIAAKLAGAKVIHTLHNYRWWCVCGIFFRDDIGICEECRLKGLFNAVKYGCFRKSKLQSLVAAMAFSFYKLLNVEKYIDYYFVLTEFQKKKIIELGIKKEKIIVKANFNTFVNSNTRIDSNEKKDYLFVGRLEKSKGIEELLDIWEKLDKEYRLVVIGDGPLRDKIYKRKSSNISFIGKMSNEEVKKNIKSAKYLIQPSILYETFGLTIIESFQMGTPVIGFDIGTRKNLIKNGYNGFVAKNSKEMIEIIKESKNREDYNNLVENCDKTAEIFYQNNVIKSQIEIYKKILEE